MSAMSKRRTFVRCLDLITSASISEKVVQGHSSLAIKVPSVSALIKQSLSFEWLREVTIGKIAGNRKYHGSCHTFWCPGRAPVPDAFLAPSITQALQGQADRHATSAGGAPIAQEGGAPSSGPPAPAAPAQTPPAPAPENNNESHTNEEQTEQAQAETNQQAENATHNSPDDADWRRGFDIGLGFVVGMGLMVAMNAEQRGQQQAARQEREANRGLGTNLPDADQTGNLPDTGSRRGVRRGPANQASVQDARDDDLISLGVQSDVE
ncbi:hypothetical protein B0T17DRAFT_508139 [Bombardia bombarda]|uniref:Uncharacterized protein n=1 Tax=Bombardia bombarda TaxID=252184 RepID=A0AA39X191_9PEZI|nr:hypothetical protein B0T17DRAFT_508139 [Bombardia bombarda]